jgi:hypothetical protein
MRGYGNMPRMLILAFHAAAYTLAAFIGITVIAGLCCTIAWVKDMRLYSKMQKEERLKLHIPRF